MHPSELCYPNDLASSFELAGRSVRERFGQRSKHREAVRTQLWVLLLLDTLETLFDQRADNFASLLATQILPIRAENSVKRGNRMRCWRGENP